MLVHCVSDEQHECSSQNDDPLSQTPTSSSPISDSSMDTQAYGTSNRPRDCGIKVFRFIYPQKSSTVKIQQPCMEARCRTCRMYQKHRVEHLPPLGTAAPPTVPQNRPKGTRQEQAHSHASDFSGSGSAEDEKTPTYMGRSKPRFRKRVVLKFTKPTGKPKIDKTLDLIPYHTFKLLIQRNKIPLTTGKKGGLAVLKFHGDEKVKFAKKVEKGVEARGLAFVKQMMGKGEAVGRHKQEFDEDDVEKVDEHGENGELEVSANEDGEDAEKEQGVGRENDGEEDADMEDKHSAEDEWWDEETGEEEGWRRRSMKFF